MFIDDEWKKEKDKLPSNNSKSQIVNSNQISYSDSSEKKVYLIIGGVLLSLILLIWGGAYFYLKSFDNLVTPTPTPGPSPTSTPSGGGILPIGGGGGNTASSSATSTEVAVNANEIFFGQYFKVEPFSEEKKISTYDLPINTKADAINYYDLSRKISVEQKIDDLNKYGFAILDNPYENAEDFYSIYNELSQGGIPLYITSDFIMYYYNNILKSIYMDIEKSVFYDNLWDITKNMYDTSITRFRKTIDEKGLINDPVLEGQRLEASFLAVVLELLKPTADQINKNPNLSDDSKFSEKEAEGLDFQAFSQIQNEVEKEVEFIRDSAVTHKSPLFLYDRDYKKFQIPNEYKNSSKHTNFYLATKWMNTLFPLFYKGDYCPNCMLDKEDWLINMTASMYFSKDFFQVQDARKDWAIIYKVISFFSGLRQDLTYIHYYDIYSKLFKDKTIEDVFGDANKNRDEDILDLQMKLVEKEFNLIEGSFDRKLQNSRGEIGMRMLQENFWPNNYILGRLTGKDIVYDKDDSRSKVGLTNCRIKGRNQYYRCSGTIYDIFNLITDIDNQSFKDNTNYNGYFEKSTLLKEEISKFSMFNWHNNNYWNTLDIAKTIIENDYSGLPVYMNNDLWRERSLSSALSSFVEIHLPIDKFQYSNAKIGNGNTSLGYGNECNKYNYIEPNIELIDHLIASTNMLNQMFSVVGLTKKTNTAAVDLVDLEKALISIQDIVRKELSDEAINKSDCEYIQDFAGRYFVESSGTDSYRVSVNAGSGVTWDVSEIKLISVVNLFDNDKVIAVGPVYNFKETRY